MRLIGKLSKGVRSLAEILDGFARKKILIGALGLGVAAAGGATTASAAFLDDFSSDTSANYTFEDSYGSGGSFDVSGGTLNIHTGGSNTAMASTTSTVTFAVGESLGVDTRSVSNAEGVFLTLGTAAGQPGAAGGDGYRWRRDSFGANDDGVRIFAANGDGIFASGIDPNPADPATLWIDRAASDTFEFYIQSVGGLTRTLIGTHTYAALGGVTDVHIGMQAFDTPEDVFPFDNLRIVDTASIGDIDMSLIVNRDTGGLTLQGDANSAVTMLGYSIESERGALDQSGWTTISGNYDASIGGDGSVDNDDAWTVLSAAGDHTDLSEAELAGGNGATLAPGAAINLSQSGGAWIKNPSEADDIFFEVLFSNGITSEVSVEFVGNGGSPFDLADLDFDGAINEQDWLVFVAGHVQDLSSFTPAQAYGMGDLDGDGDNDLADFRIFKGAFDVANGDGAFQRMLSGTPEPSSLALLGLGACLLSIRRAGGRARPDRHRRHDG